MNSTNVEKDENKLIERKVRTSTVTPPIETPQYKQEKTSKWNNIGARTFYTIIFVLGFAAFLCAGPFYMGVLFVASLGGMYREITILWRKRDPELTLPWYFSLRYYAFVMFLYNSCYMYLPLFLRALSSDPERSQDMYNLGMWLIRKKNELFWIGMFLGLIGFVLSLSKFTVKYKFIQLGVALATSILFTKVAFAATRVACSGIFWTLLGFGVVAVNDIFAYLIGVSMGKHRLLVLSPNKTWEGFLGAAVVTMFFTYLLTWGISRHAEFMLCPTYTISADPFDYILNSPSSCPTSESLTNPKLFRLGLGRFAIELKIIPIVIHSTMIGLFASFGAPFGGFLASGLKRAINVKDFGNSISGHGGITDRCDCHALMAMFLWIYTEAAIFRGVSQPSDFELITASIAKLSYLEQGLLVHEIQKYLL